MEPKYEALVAREQRENPRYRWLGVGRPDRQMKILLETLSNDQLVIPMNPASTRRSGKIGHAAEGGKGFVI